MPMSFITCQTTLKAFKKTDFSVVREHEEFVWLHDRLVEEENYAGFVVSSVLTCDPW